MIKKFFGTDGIRGQANQAPMDPETVLRVGMAAGAYFTNGDHRHRVVIGKDTRLSGYSMEPALTSGLVSMGMHVFLLGPIPTPAVSMLTRALRADLGVMISASHNPFQDNGIKFFDSNGLKLSDKVELEIEELMDSDMSKLLIQPNRLGRAKRIDDAKGRYIEKVKQTFPKNLRLDGLKIVIDCANGAAYKVAPAVLWELGAEIITMGVEPNGFNINENCGSTCPEGLCEKVLEHKADIGIALDGDADRLIISNEKGQIVNGDQIMAAIASYWKETNNLRSNGIVATVMSNLGLEKYLESIGLAMERTQVGDRYVSEKMNNNGYNLGGEQSGHIIFNDFTNTGDGLVAALQVLAILVEKQKPASEILSLFDPLPQILKNIEYDREKPNPLENNLVKEAIEKEEQQLNKSGRVLIRKSGTEPIIRVMSEGEDQKQIEGAVDSIIGAIKQVQSESA